MKKIAIWACSAIVAWAIPFLMLAAEDSEKTPELSHKLEIRPQNPKDWKDSATNVNGVLNAAAGELWKYFPDAKLPPILVWPKGGPITLFDRGPKGEIQIKLDTGDSLWAQYTFQFAHEMCHALANCIPRDSSNKWFEESLCETASIFALRHMSETWKTAPRDNWKSFAPHLKSYAEDRVKLGKVPDGKTFLEWFHENEPDMRLKSTDRARNNIVAGVLLPLLEAEPERWEAITWLNTEKLSKPFEFKQYLEAWRRNCPEKHRAFVDKVAKEFGIKLSIE